MSMPNNVQKHGNFCCSLPSGVSVHDLFRAGAFETPVTFYMQKPLGSAVVCSSKSKDGFLIFVDKH